MTPTPHSSVTPGRLVANALELAGLGFCLLPVVRGTKRLALPATGEALVSRASRDPELVRYWFSPDQHDVAIVPAASGHIVCDIDTKKPHKGAENTPKYEALSGYSMQRRWSDETATALTPSRGWHVFWTLPADVGSHELRGQLADGLELKANTLLVVPPSRGRRWLHHPREIGCAPMPAKLVDIARRPLPISHETAGRPRSLAAIHRWLLRDVKEGERNNCLHWAACEASRAHKRGEVSLDSVLMLTRTGVEMGLPERECESTVRSAMRAELGSEPSPTRPAPASLVAAVEPFVKIPHSAIDTLGGGPLLVYVHLARRANWRTGEARASVRGIATALGVSWGSVGRWLRELRDRGLISYTNVPGPGKTTIRIAPL